MAQKLSLRSLKIGRVGILTLALISTTNSSATTPQCIDLFNTSPVTSNSKFKEFPEMKISDVMKVSSEKYLTAKANEDFDIFFKEMLTNIELEYGPRNAKSITMKINWEQMKAEALKTSKGLKTDLERYFFITELFAKFNDGHVSFELPSSLIFSLPLQFFYIGDKFVIHQIDSRFPRNLPKPEIGDELIKIDDMTPEQYQQKLNYFHSAGNSLTNKMIFSMGLSRLRESRGVPLSNKYPKNIQFEMKRPDGTNYTLNMKYKAEGLSINGKTMGQKRKAPYVKGIEEFSRVAPQTARMFSWLNSKFRGLVSLSDDFAPELDLGKSTENKKLGSKIQLGARKPYFQLPALFEEIQTPKIIPGYMKDFDFDHFLNGDHFFAGKTQHNGKIVGLLRIPSYEPKNIITILQSIRYYISRLQNETDYLIIDQTRNPGGMVSFSDLIIKAFVGRYNSNVHMKFAVKPKLFKREFEELITTVRLNEDGLLTKEEVNQFLPELKAEYNKLLDAERNGQDLSEPINLNLLSQYFEVALDRLFIERLSNTAPDNLSFTQNSNTSSKDFQDFNNKYQTIFDKNDSNTSPSKKSKEAIQSYTYFAMQNLSQLIGINIMKPAVYTKPVFFLIDALDFSGGDATPALFQDYQRARLIGLGSSHTGGAGGTVEEKQYHGALNFIMHITTSLMARWKGKTVENTGVDADVVVPLTDEDTRDNYQNVFGRILNATDADYANALQQSQRYFPPNYNSGFNPTSFYQPGSFKIGIQTPRNGP